MSEEQLGARLKRLRKQFGYTQEEVAQKLHTSRGSISMYENGRRQPSYDLLIQIADLFQVNLDYLLGKSQIASLHPQLTPEEFSLIEGYRRADVTTRQIIRTLLRSIPPQRNPKKKPAAASAAPASRK